MPWQKMRFRGDVVSVLVDDSGRPVLDGDGRAEMKYRDADARSYRPGPANLAPLSPPGSGPASPTPAKEPPAPGDLGPTRLPSKALRAQSSATTAASARIATGLESEAAADTYHVWTDGACSGNPGPMGIGVVVIAGDHREELGEYLGIGTNNIAELVAIERGLELVANHSGTQTGKRVRVYSDSSYAIGLLDKAWKAKANQELVARIRKVLSTFRGKVEFVKVRGHAGLVENERCDQLGRDAITRARR